MYQSIPTAHGNSRVFMACLLAFSMLVTPLAAVATPDTTRNSPSTNETSEPLNASPNIEASLPVPVAASLLPSISASMVDSFPAGFDVDLDGKAEPGDKIRYTTTITNAGPDPATSLHFSGAPDVNTTFVGGSIVIGPLAINESYQSVGNMTLTSANIGVDCNANSLRSVLCNDSLNGATLTGFGNAIGTANGTAPGSPVTTTNGGTVVLNADGTFVYNPAAGFEGSDSFFYTLTNNTITPSLSNTAQVTINVGGANGMVWFISSAGGGTGRQANPFTLAAFNTANTAVPTATTPGDNDAVFLFEGVHTGPVTLRTGQKFIGQDTNDTLLSLGAPTAQPGNAYPAINNPTGTAVDISSASSGITLASGNTLSGFTVGNTGTGAGQYDIANTTTATVGTLFISDVILNGTGGLFRADAGGALNVTFDSGSTTNAGSNGIQLNNITGSFTVNGSGTISGVAGVNLFVSGGTATIGCSSNLTKTSNGRLVDFDNYDTGTATISGTLTCNTSCDGVEVTNNGAGSGTVNFTGGTKTLNTGADIAVNLDNNDGGNVNFTGGGLVINTTSAIGFNATNGGTVTVQGAGNTITSGMGTALNIANTNIGLNHLNFVSISTSGRAAASCSTILALAPASAASSCPAITEPQPMAPAAPSKTRQALEFH